MEKKTEITYIHEKTFDIQEFNHLVDDELVTCEYCGHQWDGWAQCMCLGIVEDDINQPTPEIKITQPKRMTLRSDTEKNNIQKENKTKNCCSKK